MERMTVIFLVFSVGLIISSVQLYFSYLLISIVRLNGIRHRKLRAMPGDEEWDSERDLGDNESD